MNCTTALFVVQTARFNLNFPSIRSINFPSTSGARLFKRSLLPSFSAHIHFLILISFPFLRYSFKRYSSVRNSLPVPTLNWSWPPRLGPETILVLKLGWWGWFLNTCMVHKLFYFLMFCNREKYLVRWALINLNQSLQLVTYSKELVILCKFSGILWVYDKIDDSLTGRNYPPIQCLHCTEGWNAQWLFQTPKREPRANWQNASGKNKMCFLLSLFINSLRMICQ